MGSTFGCSTFISCGLRALRIRRAPFSAWRFKRRTKSGCRLFCYLGQFFSVSLLCFCCMWCFVSLVLVVTTGVTDCLERLVSEMTYYV